MNNFTHWIKLEMETSGFNIKESKWNTLKALIETSSPIQQKRIQQRIMNRYKNKEGFETIVNHLIDNLSRGTLQ